MKKILILFLALGTFFSSNAMALHTCGQPLGSCLVHIDPIVLPTEKPQKLVPARPIQQYQPLPPGPRPEPKCFMQVPGQGMVEIPCPRKCYMQVPGGIVKIPCPTQ